MNRLAVYNHFYAGSIEVFVLKFAKATTIDCVGAVRTKARHVKEIGTTSHFLIRSEGNFDFAVGDLWVGNKCFRKAHDNCHACFVVRAQKCCAVGTDDGFANVSI